MASSSRTSLSQPQVKRTETSFNDQQSLRQRYTSWLNHIDLQHGASAVAGKPISNFMREFTKNIIDYRRPLVELQLELLEQFKMGDLLSKYNEEELSPLQLAVFFSRPEEDKEMEVIQKIVSLCPGLIFMPRKGRFAGQTVLHVAITTRKIKAAKFVLDKAPRGHRLLHVQATGPGFASTVMMGELPLSVAALTFNLDMVKFLHKKGANMTQRNSTGDTVFHSLVRYANLFPQNLESAKKMMRDLNKMIEQRHLKSKDVSTEIRDVWMIENKEGLTPLRLAAALAQPELFKLILNLGGVYKHLDSSDGLFDSVLYDITELDPLALRDWSNKIRLDREKEKHNLNSLIGIEEKSKTPSQRTIWDMVGLNRFGEKDLRKVSVLEIVCETKPMRDSFLRTDVVKKIVSDKWNKYKCWFWGWAVLHFVFMILLSAYTVYRSWVIRKELRSEEQSSAEKAFVTAVSIMCLIAPFVVWPLELVMWRIRRQPYKFQLLHHNGIYRLTLLIFSFCLAFDAFWFLVPAPNQNYSALVAVLSGWWFLTFFLRPLKKFSFFTVMLQKVVFGDMLRFFVIIILMWTAFSVAMHSAYIAWEDEIPASFSTFLMSMLTMFQLLVGMAETGDALPSKDWLPVILYATFVLITFVLMLNALIAMMSSTCTMVYNNREVQWELQRLSVVLMLENLLPFDSLKHRCGNPDDDVVRFDFRTQRPFKERRHFLQVYTAQHSKQQEQKEKHETQTEKEYADDDDPRKLLAAFATRRARMDNPITLSFPDKKKQADGEKQSIREGSTRKEGSTSNNTKSEQGIPTDTAAEGLTESLLAGNQREGRVHSSPESSLHQTQEGMVAVPAPREGSLPPVQRPRRAPPNQPMPDVYYITPQEWKPGPAFTAMQ